MKIYTLIGGVNGAGKSSLTGALKEERSDLGVIVDPDKITQALGGDEYAGGKLAVQRIEDALQRGENLTQETTLSGGYPRRLVKRAKQAGYTVRLYYVGIDTLQDCLQRIQNRVAKGGHDIARTEVERRFFRRSRDAVKILPYCDEAKFFDNNNGFVLVAEYHGGQIFPQTQTPPQWLRELMEAHADLAKM